MITRETAEQQLWSLREFGHACLGNQLRTRRLVSMSAAVAASPAGRVTQVFADAADREGAYRFLESDHVAASAILASAAHASAKRAWGQPYVHVPVDGSSLKIWDPTGIRGVGPIGTRKAGARGLKVMNAVIVGADGTPLGLGHQIWWSRSQKRARKHRHKRRIKHKETRHWLEAIRGVQETWTAAGSPCRLWFQLDREGDFRELLEFAATSDHWVTVRSGQDRRVRDHRGRRLKVLLREAPFLGQFQLSVSASPHRRARTASISVYAKEVTLLLRDKQGGGTKEVTFRAVLARESRTTPHDEEPIEWLLLTNRPVDTFDDALAVIQGYAQRWKIEQFHRTWKSTCRVEDTQLRSIDAILRWATLLASVAMRIDRLRDLAQNSPNEPATVELAPYEIEALIWVRATKEAPSTEMPTIRQAVYWIAQLGGYTGKSSGGPPGSATLGRGLQRLESAALLVKNQQAHGAPKT